MAKNKLHIEEFKDFFKNKDVVDTRDISHFYGQLENNIKSTTLNWRIFKLVQLGILQRIGRGRFTFGDADIYIPELASATKSIYKKLKLSFPYLNFCVWNTALLNEFMQHQPNNFFIIVETEKEAINSVFYFLKESKKAVFIEPTNDILEKYVLTEQEVIIVKHLVSEAPTQNVNGIETISIEKMLVDIYCDKVIFIAQQGRELRNIYSAIFDKFIVNQSKMLRYAARRTKSEEISKFVKTITNLWQY